MWFALMSFGYDGKRLVRLPIPLVLFWPIGLLVILVGAVIGLCLRPRLTWHLLCALAPAYRRLAGLEVNVRSRDGARFGLRLI